MPAPHAVLDPSSRNRQARRIATILVNAGLQANATVLDVGTGSGHIAGYLSDNTVPQGRVTSVDVVDLRVRKAGFDYVSVAGAALPFGAATFDCVVSNHLLEHLASPEEQQIHLKEVTRVLKTGGILYVAVPNRWFIWESHFDLPFLSWLPSPVASKLVRLAGKGDVYDCIPLSDRKLRGLLKQTPVSSRSVAGEAASFRLGFNYNSVLPGALLSLMRSLGGVLLPTFVRVGIKESGGGITLNPKTKEAFVERRVRPAPRR